MYLSLSIVDPVFIILCPQKSIEGNVVHINCVLKIIYPTHGPDDVGISPAAAQGRVKNPFFFVLNRG